MRVAIKSGRLMEVEVTGLGGVGMGHGGVRFQKSDSCRDNGGCPSLNPAVGTVMSAADDFVADFCYAVQAGPILQV